MSNGMNELFTAALGLSSPWQVSEVRFEQAAHEIHFDVRCEARRLPCPRCGAAGQPIHDRQARDWQHLHFFQFRAFVHAEVPRVRCAVCGERGEPEVHQVLVPWARARSGFTLLMEALVVTLVRMSGMPVRQIGALLGVTDQRLWRSLEALVDAARAEVSMAAVTADWHRREACRADRRWSAWSTMPAPVRCCMSRAAPRPRIWAPSSRTSRSTMDARTDRDGDPGHVAGLHRRRGAASAGGCDVL